MMTGRNRFNIYLLLALAVAFASGCQTGGDKREKLRATLRVHVEVVPESMDFSMGVPIVREKPVMINVDKDPFLTEVNVAGAKVVDVPGGFNLEIQLNRQGKWLLENYTTTNPDKHFAIFSAFEDKDGKKQGRWLGAPILHRRVSSGVLSFTPDATREEAEQIALCLNNVAKKNKEASKW